jgi:hypothetical protein
MRPATVPLEGPARMVEAKLMKIIRFLVHKRWKPANNWGIHALVFALRPLSIS